MWERQNTDSCLVVVIASPAINVRSLSRKSDTCPGECPGVAIQRQPGMPGTLPSRGSSWTMPLMSMPLSENNGDMRAISPRPTWGPAVGSPRVR